MKHNIISQEDLLALLESVYYKGLSDGSDTLDLGWDEENETYSEFLRRRCKTRITKVVESTGKYRIK